MEPAIRVRDVLFPIMAVMAMVVTAACLVVALIYEDRQNDAVRAEVRISFCEQIEQLKAGFREKAIEDYQNLDRTLRLLKLERTPAIEREAIENRDEKLAQFAPIKGGCSEYASVQNIVND